METENYKNISNMVIKYIPKKEQEVFFKHLLNYIDEEIELEKDCNQ